LNYVMKNLVPTTNYYFINSESLVSSKARPLNDQYDTR